ncbi:hypothetical protein E2562_034628 [Oryza meyeriana var. granulata]|uniref:Uncharacterized protein n=1 Tax=Oryza meyeriana var. granulata TaxID=110450 RepID=A0A6G1E692_9ORYZ|nr:hypothetical protein E2562_034628 [Oryza meyeriana var. granulata]
MTRCLVWAGELVDTQKAGEGLGSDTLYLRLAGLDVAGFGRRGGRQLQPVVWATLVPCPANLRRGTGGEVSGSAAARCMADGEGGERLE